MSDRDPRFDPIALLKTLDRHRVSYIVIGAIARIIHGADEVTSGLDIVPSPREENLRRLQAAIEELGADLKLRGSEPVATILNTDAGELRIVPEPTGTRGYDDLRRAATREPLGGGVRPSVASVGDLGRMLAARGRDIDLNLLKGLRRVGELEAARGIDM